jgi:hypothetical protein
MTTEERFTRIESILERVVDNQAKFDTVLATLAEAQINLAQAQKETQEQMRALERQWQAYLNTIRPQ